MYGELRISLYIVAEYKFRIWPMATPCPLFIHSHQPTPTYLRGPETHKSTFQSLGVLSVIHPPRQPQRDRNLINHENLLSFIHHLLLIYLIWKGKISESEVQINP